MAFVPVAEFMPDMPAFENPGSGLIQNVTPLTALSYGPFKSLSMSAGPIANRCQGAFAFRDNSGSSHLYAGDSSKLYRMSAGDIAPVDASIAGGYSTGSAEIWSSTVFGNRVIMVNYANLPQSFVEGTSTKFSNLILTGTTSLSARYVATVRDFVTFANTTDATFGAQTQRVWWTSINDPTNVPTPGTTAATAVQSDYQDLPGDFGWITGIVGALGNSHAAIFMERAVFRMNYQGPPAIFRFDIAEGVRGCPAPQSLCQVGALVYYLGEDGFYAFDGANSLPIGFQKVDNFFFNDLDLSNIERVTSAVDPLNKLIYWAYPGHGNIGGTPNRVLVYNWALQRWAVTNRGDVQLEVMVKYLSFGYTLEQLDAIYPNIDTMPLSFDDPSLTGGKQVIGAFDSNHQLSVFGGTSLAATVDTTEAQLFPGQLATVVESRPMVDGGTPSVAIGTRNRTTDSVVFDNAAPIDSDGWSHQLTTGRYTRARITLPAGSAFTHIEGADIEAVPAGRR